MKLIVSPSAARAMQPQQMPLREARGLLRKLGEFAADPFATHSVALPLAGRPNRARIRQADWRAVVLIVRAEDTVAEDTVIVERVDHRREVYR